MILRASESLNDSLPGKTTALRKGNFSLLLSNQLIDWVFSEIDSKDKFKEFKQILDKKAIENLETQLAVQCGGFSVCAEKLLNYANAVWV